MTKVTFLYGTMNCGKSAEVLRLIHEYKEQGKNILVIKPQIAARDSKTDIVTRSGESYPADIIEPYTDDPGNDQFMLAVERYVKKIDHLDMVVADEAQFMKPFHVKQLFNIINYFFPKTPIMMFGLLKDYQNKLFRGSKFLVEFADDLRELKAVCWFCNQKASCNLRLANGMPIRKNSMEIVIGGNNTYKSVCRYHYYHPDLGRIE